MVADSGLTLQQFPEKAVASYGEVEFSRLDRKLAMFRALAQEDRDLLPEFEPRITALAECIDANVALLSQMASSASAIPSFTPPPATSPSSPASKPTTSSPASPTDGPDAAQHTLTEHEKLFLSREVRRGLALLARDWSTTGTSVRAACYSPVIKALEAAFDEAQRAQHALTRREFRVVVPGAGAGRLPWELARRGFTVEGCEQSFTALMVGNYALNAAGGREATQMYPFAHEHSNVRGREGATRRVAVPDVDVKEIPIEADFAMRAGLFVQAYEGQDRGWDAVGSCLAFDVGEAVVGHVRRVSQILKPGGTWAFVGPMACVEGGVGDGVQLSVEEFMGLVRKSGFKVTTRETVECVQSVNPESMRSIAVKCLFVVAIKVRPAP